MTEPDNPDLSPPSWREALPRLLARLAAFVVVVVLAHVAIDIALDWTDRLPDHAQDNAERLVLLGIFALYALLIAVPFVPGIEIAIALLVLRGPELALPVYVSTLAGLSLAFLVGRMVPIRSLERFFLDLHLVGAARMIERLAPLAPAGRVEILEESLPRQFAKLALQYRYLGLALLINLPGSSMIGGGGGICLMAGISGVFTARYALPTLALAISPVPLAIWLAGSSGLMPWLPG